MKLLAVGDGPRDQRAVPNLVCRILNSDIESEYFDWHEVRTGRDCGKGYANKLKYFARRARANSFCALAVVVDRDKAPPRQKLRELRKGRDEDRQQHPPFPTALGEANPHFDVWLLDDAVAIREALQFPPAVDVPNAVKADYPKDSLSELIEQSPREFAQVSDALGEIASRISTARCVHCNDTGLAAFEKDVLAEIKPVISS